MKKLILICAIGAGMFFAPQAYAQPAGTLTDEEYAYVTMDLQGILNLTMTTNPQVDFTFKTIQEYRQGITKFNATKLEVDATVAWDLFVYAKNDLWTGVEFYSQNGAIELPAEILEISMDKANPAVGAAAEELSTTFQSLFGPTKSAASGSTPGATTQFIAGALTDVATFQMAPGTAASDPANNQFRINYKLVPGVPAEFNNASDADDLETVGINGATDTYACPGFYYLEVVYALVEDI